MLKKPEAIIFDWDNTLVASLHLIDQARDAAFEKFKHSAPGAELMNSCASKKSFFSQFGDKEQDVMDFFLLTYKTLTKDGVIPLYNAAEVLELVAASHIPMVIVSNKLNTLLNREVEMLQWNKYFDKIVGSKDTPRDKPHPDPVYVALDCIGMKPSPNIWLIGDSTVDVQCAINTNCHPILFGDKAEFDETQFSDQSFQHIENHIALRELLLRF